MKIHTELRPWREVWPNIATTLFVAIVAFIGIAEAIDRLAPAIRSTARSVAACPIHITTNYSNYCMSIGIGR